MPQISPMSWMIIIMSFLAFVTITMNSISETKEESSKQKSILQKEKNMKW